MQRTEPTSARDAARSSFTSTSQRMVPENQVGMLSLGQSRALVRFMRFETKIQSMRLPAGRLRFLICQMRAGMSRNMVKSESRGTAMAAGEMPISGTNPSMEAVLLLDDMVMVLCSIL